MHLLRGEGGEGGGGGFLGGGRTGVSKPPVDCKHFFQVMEIESMREGRLAKPQGTEQIHKWRKNRRL